MIDSCSSRNQLRSLCMLSSRCRVGQLAPSGLATKIKSTFVASWQSAKKSAINKLSITAQIVLRLTLYLPTHVNDVCDV